MWMYGILLWKMAHYNDIAPYQQEFQDRETIKREIERSQLYRYFANKLVSCGGVMCGFSKTHSCFKTFKDQTWDNVFKTEFITEYIRLGLRLKFKKIKMLNTYHKMPNCLIDIMQACWRVNDDSQMKRIQPDEVVKRLNKILNTNQVSYLIASTLSCCGSGNSVEEIVDLTKTELVLDYPDRTTLN